MSVKSIVTSIRTEDNDRGRPVSIMAVIVLGSLASMAQAATFYVAPGGSNSNPGTSPGQAWSTLQFAANNVNAGDTVHVLPGNYHHQCQ